MALMTGLALATGVESANTVGFIDHAIDPNVPVDNVGVCFVPVGNPSGSFTITDDALGMALSAGDTFYVFNANLWDFDIYTYNGKGQGWFASYADTTGETLASITVAPGASLFYMGAAATFTMCGEVRAPGTQTITFTPDDSTGTYVFPIANPFPVATTLADLETFCSAGDTVYAFNPGLWDFDIYTYNGTGAGWFASYADTTGETITLGSTEIFAPGQGASFMPGGSRTWQKTLNY